MQNAKRAQVNGLEQWRKLTMKMFRVTKLFTFDIDIIIFVLLVLLSRALQVILVTTVITNNPSVSVLAIPFFCAPFEFQFAFLVIWTLSFLGWFSCRSFVEKISNGGGRLFLTFFSLPNFDYLFVDVRSTSDVMVFFSYVIPQTLMRREDHVTSFELTSELSHGRQRTFLVLRMKYRDMRFGFCYRKKLPYWTNLTSSSWLRWQAFIWWCKITSIVGV